ncbi:MAG: serine/threonine protein kinase [Candidatus Saccharimonas sp.]|nr:serine/threonine protein kinase [Planctomycetaceae bacterium]
MTSPDDADPDSLREAELLDELLTAIQRGDTLRRDGLLDQSPWLRDVVECLSALDRLMPPQIAPDYVPTMPGNRSPTPALNTRPMEGSGVFGKYDLLGEVGRGGMGVVYKARQRDLNRIVALKMILASEWASAEEIRRFQAEARAAARLRHRNIVAIHEIGEQFGRHFFAMDFVEGESLSAIVARGALAPEQAARWMVSIAQAVEHLHSQGIVHRDLKPSNVLIDSAGEPVVMDFGLAKIFDSEDGATRSGAILGTPSYMSPEQAAGRNSLISTRSDVYSLGAMLYEMLSGRPPFREANPLDTLVQVIEGEPMLLRQLVATIPRELELICFKCLEKDPARRYASAAELSADLTRYLQGEPVEAHHGGLWQSVARWVRRQPSLAVHLAAISCALLIVQLRYWLVETDPVAHALVMFVLGLWWLSSVLWQQLLNRDRLADVSRIGTIVGDVALLTAALVLSGWTNGTLLVVYPLLIVASGLWFRVPLVWLTTLAAEVAFAALLMLQPSLRDPWHHALIVATVLLMTGAATAFQVNRVRALSRFYERRPL